MRCAVSESKLALRSDPWPLTGTRETPLIVHQWAHYEPSTCACFLIFLSVNVLNIFKVFFLNFKIKNTQSFSKQWVCFCESLGCDDVKLAEALALILTERESSELIYLSIGWVWDTEQIFVHCFFFFCLLIFVELLGAALIQPAGCSVVHRGTDLSTCMCTAAWTLGFVWKLTAG